MNQKVKASDGAVVVQAQGDVHYGLGMTEVERLFQLLLSENMPKLQTMATEKAQENTQALIELVRQEFTMKVDSINLAQLTEPDVQAIINEAVQGAAKKGRKIDLQTLASLVIDRLNEENDDFFDISLEESIRIIPKLSKDLLYALALTHFIKSLSLTNPTVDNLEEVFHCLKSELLIHCDNITDTRLITLGATGAVNYINMVKHNTLESYIERHPSLSEVDLDVAAPSLKYVLSKYDELNLHKITLTLPGVLIANKLLEPYLGKIPLKY